MFLEWAINSAEKHFYTAPSCFHFPLHFSSFPGEKLLFTDENHLAAPMGRAHSCAYVMQTLSLLISVTHTSYILLSPLSTDESSVRSLSMCSGHSVSQAASQYRGLYSLDHAFTYIIEFSNLGITGYYCLCFTEDNTEM